jgi:acyl carrier protein
VNEEQVRRIVLDALGRIAPEIDAGLLQEKEPLRDQVELDSMDFLNLVIDLHQQLGVEIPETDYAQVATLDDMVRYLVRRTEAMGHRP